MCSTQWCFGDCEECEANRKHEQEYNESITECPYRKECHWITVNIKNDKCNTCGKTYTYP